MKKIIALLLAIITICMAFTSCADKPKTDEDSLKFTFDSYFNGCDEAAIAEYEKLCKAVINGDEEVDINREHIDLINKLFYTSFPLSSLVKKLALKENSKYIEIEYVNDIEAHKTLVSEFTAKAKQIMTDCSYGTASENEYILNLYTYISSKISYDLDKTSTYDAIVNGVGSSSSYAGAFQYLLLQADIPATYIYGLNAKGLSCMVIASINGEEYIFAPCNENRANGGFGLSYFAMNYSDLLELGFKEGFKYSNEDTVAFNNNSDKFKPLRNSVSYEYADSSITAVKENGETSAVNIK